ncbi:hypothetical protein OG373_34780 [Streptomyces avidinii]|uniref:hypothetical protein n=1 Tax=Streptomyces avidinii TaxID=1895 RepID=UPI003870AF96|nr:hypothetical protein OG373_34780 [Streptomyces avidinii]
MRPPFHFPEDLITFQKAWQQIYAELAQAPAEAGTTALRRRLIALSRRRAPCATRPRRCC